MLIKISKSLLDDAMPSKMKVIFDKRMMKVIFAPIFCRIDAFRTKALNVKHVFIT